MSPTIYTESNGQYYGFDKQLHNSVEDYNNLDYTTITLSEGQYGHGSYSTQFFSDLSLWDTFRTQNPWILLFHPDITVGIMKSMYQITKQLGGYFPRLPYASLETSCMVGLHGAATIVDVCDANQQLCNTIPLKEIQQALLKQATESNIPINPREDLENYLANGFVSLEAANKSATLTLTYSFDDYVLSRLSSFVGDFASAKDALQRSKNYRHLWSSLHQFICPKSAETNELDCPKTSTGPDSWKAFTEGNTNHWTLFIGQHDPIGLINLFPSSQSFYENLENLLKNSLTSTNRIHDVLPNPYYWQGNEINFIGSWLFSYSNTKDEYLSGACTKTQYWTRTLTYSSFSQYPHGLPGNDDYGSESTWLLFNSLGFYPHSSNQGVFILGSPRVKQASLEYLVPDENGVNVKATIKVMAYNNSKENVYVEKLLINGEEYHKPVISRSIFMDLKGVTFEFFMSSTPTSGLCP
jgi:predicted alpha-1,2-mannosidase